MDDENSKNNTNNIQIYGYGERITRVEEKIQYVSTEQVQLRITLARMTDLLEGLVKQISNSERATDAIRDRTDQHTKTIEHLQESETDVSKILENMRTQLNIIKYFGAGFGTLAIGYIFTHFLK